MFCITGAYYKLLVQKVHLIVVEPFVFVWPRLVLWRYIH